MSAEFCREIARRCRELIGQAKTEGAKAQLQIWFDEFEAQAEAAEEGEKKRNPHGSQRR